MSKALGTDLNKMKLLLYKNIYYSTFVHFREKFHFYALVHAFYEAY